MLKFGFDLFTVGVKWVHRWVGYNQCRFKGLLCPVQKVRSVNGAVTISLSRSQFHKGFNAGIFLLVLKRKTVYFGVKTPVFLATYIVANLSVFVAHFGVLVAHFGVF